MRQHIRIQYSALSVFFLAACLLGSGFFCPACAAEPMKTPKYIFFFIGDGMSFPQLTALEFYRGTLEDSFTGTVANPTPDNQPRSTSLLFTTFPVLGTANTYDASKFITDSAAASTALATGFKALDGGVGVDAFNAPHPSIAHLLKKEKNYKIGIVTNVSLDHATPAGFYAHQVNRNMAYEIGLDLIKSDFDYFGGGGFRKPRGNDGKHPDLVELARNAGYRFINSTAAFVNLKPRSDQKVLAINAILETTYTSMEYKIDRKPGDLTIADYTEKGIELLMNNTGFFMMIEGGKIDWACHANDAATVIHDMIDFEDAVAVAYDFYKKHPGDTLIVVTGDHETGGFSMGFGVTGYDTFFSVLTNQKISGSKYAETFVRRYREEQIPFDTVLQDLEELFGLYLPESDKAAINPRAVLLQHDVVLLHRGYLESLIPFNERPHRMSDLYAHEPLQIAVTHILNNKAGLGWTSTSHTGLPAGVYAIGAGQELFAGQYDNTEIPKKMMQLTGITLPN